MYDSWGNILSASGSTTNAFKYIGRSGYYFDSDTVYSFLRARYYNPIFGRFLSRDPLGLAAGDENLYRFVSSDPLNSSDPSGLEATILRPGDPGAPPIAQILGDPTVQDQLNWYWHRVGANSGREEGGYVLYNTCTKKFMLTVDGMQQIAHHRINRLPGGPASITTEYPSGRPLNCPHTTPPKQPPWFVGPPEPRRPILPPHYPVVGPPEPVQGCWVVVATWHTHPGRPGGLSPRNPDDPIGQPGDYAWIDQLGIPGIVQWGRRPTNVASDGPGGGFDPPEDGFE
jgi:RHS repeat-associated protein